MDEQLYRGMSYRTAGIAAEKRTLVLIHGLSGSLSAWYPYEDSLAADFNFISVDIRGHGKSVHPDTFEAYDPAASASDIASLLEHVGAKNVILVSHSFGTIVALEFLRHHVGAAIGSIFISPVYGFHRRRLSMFLTHASAVFASLLSHLRMREDGERTDYSRFTPASDWDLRRIADDVRHTGLRSYIYSFRHIAKKDRDAEWASLTLPVLVIHGTADSYVPAVFAKELCEKLPHGTLHLVQKGNHILPLNNISEIETCIRQFAADLKA